MNTAGTLRRTADGLSTRILNPRTNAKDVQPLEQVQRLARTLADQLDADRLDPFLRQVKTLAHVEFLLTWDHAPIATWGFNHRGDLGQLDRRLAMGLDAGSLPIAHQALLALDTCAAVVAESHSLPAMLLNPWRKP